MFRLAALVPGLEVRVSFAKAQVQLSSRSQLFCPYKNCRKNSLIERFKRKIRYREFDCALEHTFVEGEDLKAPLLTKRR